MGTYLRLSWAILAFSTYFIFNSYCDDVKSLRENATKLMKDGNYAEALEIFKQILSGAISNDKPEEDFSKAMECYSYLKRPEEREDFREKTSELFKENWKLLWRVAQSYALENSWGTLVGGKFIRGGGYRERGKPVNSYRRDRVRAFQLYNDAYQKALAEDQTGRSAVSLILDYADFILRMNDDEEWRLQELTDLSSLPDYEENQGRWWGYRARISSGAPVDSDGNPIFYSVPANFAEAKSDGERWRFLLNHASIIAPEQKPNADLKYANFLLSQFGVQTLVEYPIYLNSEDEEETANDANPYAVHTLSEDETIAKLATGIKRFKMPDEHNYIKILRELSKLDKYPSYAALIQLIQIFKDRRQYQKAVECLQEGLKRFKDSDEMKRQLSEIVDDCGEFLPVRHFPAGKKPSLRVRYRNAKFANFEAFEINAVQLIEDVKAYIKSNPREIKWEKVDLTDIGRRVFLRDESKYISAKIANWRVELKPKENHYDRIQNIEVPFSKPGAYLITAKFGEGNTSRITLWLNDTIIIRKPGENSHIYFCSNALTGKPISGAEIEFFTYEIQNLDQKSKVNGRRFNVVSDTIKAKTNSDGITILSNDKFERRENLLVTVKSPSGSISYLGFDYLWFPAPLKEEMFDNIKTYVITDRPVYRPEQEVNFHVWIGRAKYEKLNDEISEFAGRQVVITVKDLFDEKVFEETFTADRFGGIHGKFKLKKDCHLGNYIIHVALPGSQIGFGGFRVEEYKKPEFEVSIESPSEPVALGEKITAKVKAKYYFGAPVTNARVKYKVERYRHSDEWFVPRPWDWLYGRGYWWQQPDYEWYPGWSIWGYYAPRPWWIPISSPPPELVMENEVPIGADGTVEIVIDSSIAKAIYGSLDQRYEITAEVVDASRRTIYGKGSCIAAAKPFKVQAWIDAGWARPGEILSASFAVRTVDGKGLAGEGKASLFKIKYNKDGIPNEEVLEIWQLNTDENGFASLKLKAGEKGQYRLSYMFEAKGAKGEGACIFNVFGDDKTDDGYRFNALEIISKKSEYGENEKALIRVNTAKKDSMVLLFVRPRNGVYPSPLVFHSINGSFEYETPLSKGDMPNIFVEALTVTDGKVHTTVKEILVPPEKCALDVEVLPSKEKYKPGEKAHTTVKITDSQGKPIANSSVVISVYDKAVEYISGGSNVPEIKAYFWKWRRNHYSSTSSSIDRLYWQIFKNNEFGLPQLGVFGDLGLSDEVEGQDATNQIRQLRAGKGIKRKQAMCVMALANREIAFSSPGLAVVNEAKMMAYNSLELDKGLGEPDMSSADIAVRKSFADTAFWVANLATNDRSEVVVEMNMPENLTTWKFKVWTLANGTRVGEGETEILTSKDFILRLQAPRFFIEKDIVTLSAVLHNYHQSAKKASVLLELEGDCLALLDDKSNYRVRKVDISAGGETRVDWKVIARSEGEATIRMKAIADDDSDAMEMKFPVYVHGMMKTVSFTSAIKPEEEMGTIEMQIPAERRVDESILEIRYSPSLALAMLDALPYMCEYPHNCTEQTLNRFLPLVVVRKTLTDMGLNLEDISKKRVNFDSQQMDKKSANFAKYPQAKNPVFDTAVFNDMVSTGLKRLENMQLSDGGWGWFSGYGEHSYAHTTSVVVHGLLLAKNYGLEVNPSVIQRGVDWLVNYQKSELERLCKHHFESGEVCKEKHPENYKAHADEIDALVYYVLAEAGKSNKEMTRILYRDRNHLRVYAKALAGLGFHLNGEKDKVEMMKRNISQYLVLDDENQTAYLNLDDGRWFWWCWHGSKIEANSFYLKLLIATEPKSKISPRLVKYLLNNRKNATYWNSTRDTAYCIEAMADYVKTSGENLPDMELEVFFDGKSIRKQKINSQNLFLFDNAITLKGAELGSGTHKLELKKTGKGTVYFSAYLSYFTLEDFITKTGLEIKVERKYYKLVRSAKQQSAPDKRGQIVKQDVEKYERIPLKNNDLLNSGDLVEVELVIETKNDYEYLIFEDMKPAGFEPCEIRSGYTGNELGAFVEFRDDRVLFYVRELLRGKHSISYRVKAEIPGTFSALPACGSGMYAPELKANSDEMKISIKD